jgi:peptidoglycan/LPS O-acetylase OafA/YrhL
MNNTSDRSNNFGFFRLAFALLVVVSHSFELVDGDRSRELLTLIFGTVSAGEIAVDGFFIISGYLVTKSFDTSRSTVSYLQKRILRIYPGFMTAYLICFFVVAPLAGGDLAALCHGDFLSAFGRMMWLRAPEVPGVFAGSPYADLDGSMWTIIVEFRCYLLVMALGLFGVFRRPALSAAVLATSIAIMMIANEVEVLVRLARQAALWAMFSAGSSFYVLRPWIPISMPLKIAAAVALIVSLSVKPLTDFGITIFGAYALFASAFWPSKVLSRINRDTDLSYGIYLYAWPIQKLLIWYVTSNPFVVLALTVFAVVPTAFVSWRVVEKPALALKAWRLRATRPALVPQEVRHGKDGNV